MKLSVAPRAIAAGMLLLAGMTSAAQAGWVTDNGQYVSVIPEGPGWRVVDRGTLRFQSDPSKPWVEYKWDNVCKTWRNVDTGEESKTWDTTYESRDVSDKDRPFTRDHFHYDHVHWVSCSEKKPPPPQPFYDSGYDGWGVYGRSVPTAVVVPNPQPLYLQLYGGLTTPGTVMFTTPEDLNLGGTFGGSIGLATSIPGVSVQVDLDHTRQEFTKFSGDFISTTSVAVLGVADFNGDGVADLFTPKDAPKPPPASLPPFDIYVGAGPAIQFLSEDYASGGTATGLGYKVLGGIRAPVGDGVSLFGQAQYGNTFMPNMATNNFTVQSGHFSVVGGVRIALPWVAK